MKTNSIRCISALLSIFVTLLGNAASLEEFTESEIPLCRALEALQPGSEVPVTIEGILSYGTLYDPDEPVCRLDVQPSTCVVFPDTVPIDTELVTLLKESHRAHVVVEGTLYGPIPVDTVDPVEPEVLNLVRRMRGRYCDQYGFRSQIVVQQVIQTKPVDPTVPWNGVVSKPESQDDIPVVSSAAMPIYPRVARALGIDGEVTAQVTVIEGLVSEVEVLTGNHLLTEETVRNIRTWRFEQSVNTSFVSTFSYRLEQRLSGTDGNLTIQAHLPLIVSITAPTDSW